jgi:hypothetical protein
MPTADIRLLDLRVPLVSQKKLRLALPSLVEGHLLTSPESMTIQLLPPQIDRSAMDRTLALIDRHWLDWIAGQLWELMSPRIRLIPDCFILKTPNTSSSDDGGLFGMFNYEASEICTVTLRTGQQTGVAWSEPMQWNGIHPLPPKVRQAKSMMQFSWEWVVPALLLSYCSSEPSLLASLNLLPAQTAALKKKRTKKLSPVQAGISTDGARNWFNKALWASPLLWMKRCFLISAVGAALNLMGMALVDWQWRTQLNSLAEQAIRSPGWPSSQASLGADPIAVVFAAAKRSQHNQGLLDDADFLTLAEKLEQLKLQLHRGDCVKSIQYDGNTLKFVLKGVAEKNSQNLASDDEVMKTAKNLGLHVERIGVEQFQLFPYAGLLRESETSGVK